MNVVAEAKTDVWSGEPAVLDTIYGVKVTCGGRADDAYLEFRLETEADPDELRRACDNATREGIRLQDEVKVKCQALYEQFAVEGWADELETSVGGFIERCNAALEEMVGRVDRLYTEVLDLASIPAEVREDVARERDEWARRDREHTDRHLRENIRNPPLPLADMLMVNLMTRFDRLVEEFAGRVDFKKLLGGRSAGEEVVIVQPEGSGAWEFGQASMALHEDFRRRIRKLPTSQRAGKRFASGVRSVMAGNVLMPPLGAPDGATSH